MPKQFNPTNNYLDSLGETIAVQALALIEEALDGKSKPVKRAAQQKFLKSYIEMLVLTMLARHATNMDLSEKELEKEVGKEYEDLKFEIESSIASAFESAMGTYSNSIIDYYCKIDPVPKAINKEPI